MDESVEIPVLYKNKELFFSIKLVVMGYTHKFQVEVMDRMFFLNRMTMETTGRSLLHPMIVL